VFKKIIENLRKVTQICALEKYRIDTGGKLGEVTIAYFPSLLHEK
jgi:hypothetical protein